MTDTCVLDAIRTPIGKLGGGLARARPDDLAAICIGVGQGLAVVLEAA